MKNSCSELFGEYIMKKDFKEFVEHKSENIIKDLNNESFGAASGLKIKNNKKTDKDSFVLFMPKGSKKRFKQLSRSERKKREIPKKISDGNIELYTDIVEIEKPKACFSLTSYNRPFYPGMQISPYNISIAGTAGIIVRLPVWGDCLVTNWHVCANPYNKNDNILNRKIEQPSGVILTQNIGKVIAYKAPKLLEEGDPWSFSTADVADFAIIQLNPNGNLDETNKTYMDKLIDIMFNELGNDVYDAWDQILPNGATFCGFPHEHAGVFRNSIVKSENNQLVIINSYCKGLGVVNLGDYVFKIGRTTNLTEGTVAFTNVISQISYNQGIGVIKNMYMVEPDTSKYDRMAYFGDSGSALYDENDYCVGSTLAISGSYLLANNIQDCFRSVIPENLCNLLRLNREV